MLTSGGGDSDANSDAVESKAGLGDSGHRQLRACALQ
jgi:hypothetical protein